MLSLSRAQIQTLVKKVRSQKLHGVAIKKKERDNKQNNTHTHTYNLPTLPQKCILVFNAMETKLTLHPATTVSKHIHIPYSQEKKHFAPPGKNELTCLVLLKNT